MKQNIYVIGVACLVVGFLLGGWLGVKDKLPFYDSSKQSSAKLEAGPAFDGCPDGYYFFGWTGDQPPYAICKKRGRPNVYVVPQ